MKGRKPTPPNLRMLHGGKPRNTPRDPLAPCLLRAPRWLQPASREHFRRLAKVLNANGITCQLDQLALSLLADNLALRDKALAGLAETGELVPGPRGAKVKSPYLTILNGATDRVTKLLAEFGLTPTGRVRVQPLTATPKDDEDGLFDV